MTSEVNVNVEPFSLFEFYSYGSLSKVHFYDYLTFMKPYCLVKHYIHYSRHQNNLVLHVFVSITWDLDQMPVTVSLAANLLHCFPTIGTHHMWGIPKLDAKCGSGWCFKLQHALSFRLTHWSIIFDWHRCWCVYLSSFCKRSQGEYTFSITFCCQWNVHQHFGKTIKHLWSQAQTSIHIHTWVLSCHWPHSWCWFFGHL